MEGQHSPKQVVANSADFELYKILLDDFGERKTKRVSPFPVKTEHQYQGISSSQVDANVCFSCVTHTSALMI